MNYKLFLILIFLITPTLVSADIIIVGNDTIINLGGNLGFINNVTTTNILITSNNTLTLDNIKLGNITYSNLKFNISDDLNVTLNNLYENATILKCNTIKSNESVKVTSIDKTISLVLGANAWNEITNYIEPFTGESLITIIFSGITNIEPGGFLLIMVIGILAGILLMSNRK